MEKLQGYQQVEAKDIEHIPINTHIRYFTRDLKTGKFKFRSGGFLLRKNDPTQYIMLSNLQTKPWSVQVKDAVIFKKLSEKDHIESINKSYERKLKIKEEMIQEMTEKLTKSLGKKFNLERLEETVTERHPENRKDVDDPSKSKSINKIMTDTIKVKKSKEKPKAVEDPEDIMMKMRKKRKEEEEEVPVKPKSKPKEIPKKTPKKTPKKSLKEAPKKTPKKTPIKTPKETPKKSKRKDDIDIELVENPSTISPSSSGKSKKKQTKDKSGRRYIEVSDN